MSQRVRFLVAILVAVLASAGITLAVTDTDNNGTPDTVTFKDSKGHSIVASKEKVQKAKLDAPNAAEHAGEKKETISPATQQKLSTQAKKGTSGSNSPTPIAQGATFTQEGCRTIPVSNYSSRGSLRPGIGVAHYTVQRNVAGWSDVLAIVSLFNNPRYQASSNYIVDREGHCAYIVSEAAKAWTQGNMNSSTACSIEMVGDRNDNGYVGAGLAKSALIFKSCFKRWGIPVRRGATSGCNITRTGLVDHNELSCGNDHNDIVTDVLCPSESNTIPCVDVIVRAMKGATAAASALSKVETTVVAKRCYHRARHLKEKPGTAAFNEDLKWSRFYRDRILVPSNRTAKVGGHIQLIPAIDAAKRADGKPWSFRHRGSRRKALAGGFSGKGC